MTAGESADEVARAAARAAEALERRAAQARRRADAFAAGAQGERILAASVAGLAAHGWFLLPDRRTSRGGNIDLLLVGPPGVMVLDAKHWSGVVGSTGLAVGRHSRRGAADALAAVAAEVRSSLGSGQLSVQPILVLTHEANRGHPARVHGGVVIVGVDHVVAHLLSLAPRHTPAEIEATAVGLMSAATPAGSASTSPGDGDHLDMPGSGSFGHLLYERFNRYYYVHPWSRAGRRRLYLNSADGDTIAFKDLATGVVAVTDDQSGNHVRTLLSNATAAGLGLTKETVPRVPAEVKGGRLLSSLTRIWVTFHVGYRWRKGTLDRLYCVRADPSHGIDELGYIDLTDGTIRPVHDRPLGKDLGTPGRYLELHRERFRVSV